MSKVTAVAELELSPGRLTPELIFSVRVDCSMEWPALHTTGDLRAAMTLLNNLLRKPLPFQILSSSSD